jgi:hypothetical protein
MLAFEKSFELFLSENNYAFSHFIDEELQAKVYQLAAIPLQIILLKNDQIATEEQALDLQSSALNSFQNNTKRILLMQYQWEFKREIVASRLRSLMGLNQKIHGRKCQILRVDKLAASEFLNANHLQGNCNARYHFALVLEKEILAMATFSAARMLSNREVPARSFELLRFASKKGFTVVGGLTKILHHFQDIQKMDELMTYTDIAFAGNAGFKKMGFEKHSFKKPMPFYLIENGEMWSTKKNGNNMTAIPIFHLGSFKLIKKYP